MKKHMLMDIFEHAQKSSKPYLFIAIDANGTEEAIVIPRRSFEEKKLFYRKAYNDDLTHIMNEGVRIVSFDYGDADKLKFII